MWDLFVSLFTSVLLWIYNLLGAGPHMFGVAIILFTILIRIVTWPLNAQQMKGAAAMQKAADGQGMAGYSEEVCQG
jgi:YidC/Oxa1 family membrane protein insertase